MSLCRKPFHTSVILQTYPYFTSCRPISLLHAKSI